MRHAKRIVEAFDENGIERILLIDDGYDPPPIDRIVLGELTDFLDSDYGRVICLEAGLSPEEFEAARQAALDNNVEAEELSKANTALYERFVATRESRFDPGGRFENLKGATLDALTPLAALLEKCVNAVDVRYVGLDHGKEVYRQQKPQVVFLDFYLSPDVPVGDSSDKDMTTGRKQSIDFLGRILKATEDELPAIVLMSSHSVKNEAEKFRQDVEPRGHNPLALRFRFLQKDWVKAEAGNKIKIENEAADALLDTTQGFAFGQILQRALRKWREGADKAMNALLEEIGGLEPKDFAYLFRFRLVSEGSSMSDYLEWMFGESLRALVAEHVPWRDEDFDRLDDPDRSKGIEGAFEGPSTNIAKIFHRIRIDKHKSRPPGQYALGDIYVSTEDNSVRGVVTPDCDLVVRKGATKAMNVLTMGGELRSFDQDSASADQFIFRNGKPYSLKWNPKNLETYPVKGERSLEDDSRYQFAGTLRPLYAQEMQRQSLTDLSRVGLAVAPVMGVDAKVTAWLRMKKGGKVKFEKCTIKEESAIATVLLERAEAKSGHKVLLRRRYVHALLDNLREVDPAELPVEDRISRDNFLKEKNEDKVINGFLREGSLTKGKGPLGTKIAIGGKPDGNPWLQLLLELSEEAMKELRTIDPLLPIAEGPEANSGEMDAPD